ELIKIHKVLLNNRAFECISEPYLKAVKRLNPTSLPTAKNYIKFLAAYLRLYDKFQNELSAIITPYLNRRLKDFIFLTYMAIGQQIDMVLNGFNEQYKNKDKDHKTLELRNEFQSAAHNILRGVMADSMFALTRLINFYAINRPLKTTSLIITHCSEE